MLVVEDGTGLPDAEAYVSVLDADSYHARYANAKWATVDGARKETLLRKASRDLDLLMGTQYASRPLTSSQALLFPRRAFRTPAGQLIDGIPAALQNAIAELALLSLTVDVTGPLDESGNIKSISKKLDVLERKTEFFAPTASAAAPMRKINLLMQSLLASNVGGLYAPVVRG